MDPKPKVADIGCGFHGRFLRLISNRIIEGYGIDIRANEKQYGNIKIVNNSSFGGKMPFKDNTFDRVFMLAVLEHLPVGNGVVDEAVRILRGGEIYRYNSDTSVKTFA